ncbi:MAG: hypothetical protein AAGA69_06180 [Pseudomonadota bacterium]
MLIVIIIDYITIMSGLTGVNGPPTIEEVAVFASDNFSSLSLGWHFEVIAMALLGAASLTLMTRESRIGWALTAIGVVVVAPMYAIMIGGYGAVFAASEMDTNLYAAFRSVATEVFYAGNLLLNAGLALAFILEFYGSQRIMPAWFLVLAALANAVVAIVFALTHFGLLADFRVAGPVIIVAFLLTAIFGGRLIMMRTS